MGTEQDPVVVIGGGLAGAEVSFQLARRGVPVRLYEMKPHRRTPAQVSDQLAELVCSNSFRSSSLSNAVGVIKEEMRRLGSVLMDFAEQCRVPAGDALAVDRDKFAAMVTAALQAEPNVEVIHEEVKTLPSPGDASDVVVATGPLTAPELATDIARACGDASRLYFYDAIAPIVSADSIDMTQAYARSRYGKGEGDEYINCPLDEAQYLAFVESIVEAERVTAHEFEDAKFFEGCLPIEVMASRGVETLRYGCMKPVGLEDPRTGEIPHAVVQLRTENRDRTAFNLVGFQTRMKWGEQKAVLRRIPGLQDAEFLRLGQVHRNTYLDSPQLLDSQFRLRSAPYLTFAGQITGVEGYVESTASGLLVGLMIAARRTGRAFETPSVMTALGALHGHVLGTQRPEGAGDQHVPSNIHWGLFPRLNVRAKKRDRKRMYGERALVAIDEYRSQLVQSGLLAAAASTSG